MNITCLQLTILELIGAWSDCPPQGFPPNHKLMTTASKCSQMYTSITKEDNINNTSLTMPTLQDKAQTNNIQRCNSKVFSVGHVLSKSLT